jgi:hypothetical protein
MTVEVGNKQNMLSSTRTRLIEVSKYTTLPHWLRKLTIYNRPYTTADHTAISTNNTNIDPG